MTRRERIRSGMGVGGGTSAPGGRRDRIKAALGEGRPRPAGGRMGLPGKMPGPKRFPQVGQNPARGNAILNPNSKIGGQLAGRVASGALTQQQAQRTAQQRQTLKKAFGSDWRSQVFAGSGPKEIRQGGPFANRQIAAERAKGLRRAKRKLY